MAKTVEKSGKKKNLGLLLLLLLGGGAAIALASSKSSKSSTPPPPTTHKVCSGGKCIDTTGAGADECSPTKPCPVLGVSHKECDGTGKCVVVNTAGADTCTIDGDCPIPGETHNVCSNGKCIAVAGFGPNDCFADGDCPATPPNQHKECDTATGKCITVLGKGNDLCATDNQCLVTHKACQNGKCENVPGIGQDECTVDGECSCAGHCGQITPGGCSCKVGCETQGNCCGDKALVCDAKTKLQRVLIAACANSLNEMDRAQFLKNSMITAGWQDGVNIATAFVTTLSSFAQLINDTNPEVIILVGADQSWSQCSFNAWNNYFSPVKDASDSTNMAQMRSYLGICYIGLGGSTITQTDKLVHAFGSFAGYVADEISFQSGKAPANLCSFEPAWLFCKGDCTNTQTVPYCFCGSSCFGPTDPNCCYDSDEFCP